MILKLFCCSSRVVDFVVVVLINNYCCSCLYLVQVGSTKVYLTVHKATVVVTIVVAFVVVVIVINVVVVADLLILSQ